MHHPTKIVILMLLGALGCAGLTLPQAAAQEEVITLEALAGGGQRLPVAFGHDLHMGLFECLDCHHDYREGVNVLEENALEEGNPDLKCGTCHHADASLDRQKAFHRLCIGCHIQVRKAGGARGPEMCGACHRPPS
jgi:hypothetical protein